MKERVFRCFSQNLFHLVFITFIYMILTYGLSYVIGVIPIVGSFASLFLTQVALIIYLKFFISIFRKKNESSFTKRIKNTFGEIKECFLKVLGVSLVRLVINTIGILIIGGTILFNVLSTNNGLSSVILTILVVTLLFFSVNFISDLCLGFTLYMAVDNDYNSKSVKDTFIDGFKMMKGYRLKFIWLRIVSFALNFLGSLLLGIGVLFSRSYTELLFIDLYERAKIDYLKKEDE